MSVMHGKTIVHRLIVSRNGCVALVCNIIVLNV